jgi:hypothetical protein
VVAGDDVVVRPTVVEVDAGASVVAGDRPTVVGTELPTTGLTAVVAVGAVVVGALGSPDSGATGSASATRQARAGAPPSSASRSAVSAGRPVERLVTPWATSAMVPRSPGWIGRYSPLGHMVNAVPARRATPASARTGCPKRRLPALDHARPRNADRSG